MNYLLCLVALCATWGFGAAEVGTVGSIFDLDLYGGILMDDDDKRPMSRYELDAKEYLEEYNKSRSFLAVLVGPTCDFEEWMYPSCCITLEVMDHPHEICVDMALEWRELKISLALNHNGEVLFTFEFVLGEICVGLPYMRKIGLCGHVYHIDVQRKPNKPMLLRACLTLNLKIGIPLMEFRFYCLDATQNSNAALGFTIERNDKINPESSGMIAVLIKKDKVAIEFNSPIPKELIDAMKRYMNAAIEKIGEAIMVVKNAVVQTWNTVASAATNAWKAVSGWFSSWG